MKTLYSILNQAKKKFTRDLIVITLIILAAFSMAVLNEYAAAILCFMWLELKDINENLTEDEE